MSLTSGGLPSTFFVGGITLTVESISPTYYTLSFGVTGVTYNGVYLDTISGDPYNYGDGTQSNPQNFLNGTLRLVDMSSYNPGVTFIDFLYASGVVVNTNSSGDATEVFNVPPQNVYDFQLFYNTYFGTVQLFDGTNYGSPYGADFTQPISVPFIPPTYGPDGLFSVDTINVTPLAATYASVQLVGTRYNGSLLGTTGSIFFYKDQGSDGTTLGGSFVNAIGTTLNSISGFFNGEKSGAILYPPGPTFDTVAGAYYMKYFVDNTFHAANYINLPEIKLPVNATVAYDTGSNPGTTLATITNLTYNFVELNPGDSVGISQIGAPFETKTVSAQRSVTYTAINASIPANIYYQNPNMTYSALSYSTPAYSGVPEQLTAAYTFNSQQNISSTSNPNDGFKFRFMFDYKDSDQVSVFSRGHTGIVQINGLGSALGFSKSLPVNAAGVYELIVDNKLTSQQGLCNFDFSFYDSTINTLRGATGRVDLAWHGLYVGSEQIRGTADAFIEQGTTFRYFVNSLDYIDAYGYSLFSPNYVARSELTGVTSAPLDVQTQFVVHGGTYINITSPGFVSFGITASSPYLPGTTIIGQDGANTFGGTVFYSSLNELLVNCTTFSSPANSNKWGITGSYATYNGVTGTINIVQSTGKTVASFPYRYGVSSYTGLANEGTSGTTGSLSGITYGVYLYNNSAGATLERSLPLPIQRSNNIGPSGNTGYGPNGNPGPTGVTYLNGGGTGAILTFSYMYNANANVSKQYQVLGEVDKPITTDYEININVPADDMSRMLIYQSAWNIIDQVTGLTLSGFLGGGNYGQTGIALMDPISGEQVTPESGTTYYYGPHVGFLLGSVLNNIQYYDGTQYTSKPRLQNLDKILGNTGSTGGAQDFPDDLVNHLVSPIGKIYSQQSFAAGNNRSILSIIPTEAISSITSSGLTLTQLSNLFVDIDTKTAGITAGYIPALHNIFSEAVAFGKVDNTVPIAVSDFGFFSTASGVTISNNNMAAAWNTGLPTYGVNFEPGDKVTLYVKYKMTKQRKFQVSPWVTNGLDPTIFSLGQVLSINIGGNSVSLPLGPDAWTIEESDPAYATYSINLISTSRAAPSVFDS